MKRLAFLAVWACATTALADFDGPYEPANWTLVAPADSLGTLDTNTMYIQGINSNFYTPAPYETYYGIKAAADESLTLDWEFGTNAFPNGDWFYYEINGSKTIVTTSPGSGSLSIPVLFDDDVVFGVESADNLFGAGFVTITNFAYIPEPGTLMMLAIPLLALRRRG
jgi:hypothetical protein